MTGQPEADELRIRSILRKQGVGPDADPDAPARPAPPAPPRPTARPRDWLDDLLDSNKPAPAPDPDDEPAGEPDEDAEEAKPAAPIEKATAPPKAGQKKKQKKAKKPKPGAPRTAWDSRPQSPRQSLLDAWDRVPDRIKWLLYHAAAAYLGWSMGLVGWCTYVTAWITVNGATDPQSIFWYIVGAAAFLLHHATRRRWWPVAWFAAVPASSLVVGVLLYGNGWTELELSL